ncbi:Glu-tRNA(Gln) amidotransferase GatDE subunit E [Candidatus Pacearchaeota archaeon CG10_big_fil_rev_8_21_14_0_10_31_24]|nr:MAG: Glu-tRNA(Gln) amidotransferase GatDE subunit E [Candidatus Pacearchaeota archaeon CG10_big_fil_rev_8_21_14_0_10_31_24]
MVIENELDYEKLGLKAGLEIHQQLDTGRKLFCECPTYLRSDKSDFIVRRKLHAVAGENGEIDAAVKHEASLDKDFFYEGYKDSTCLIECDEEPPKFISEEALSESLKIALLLNCEIYSFSQVMRKTVIDGSNTGGFQRTVLFAHDGFIECSFGKVRIDTVVLEEDSARIVSKDDKKSIYKLDRLGIPLIEIATAPDMKTPEEIKECALKIGEILRVCRVKRGIGTIRQDVNISIKKHDRVEVKGFQDPKIMIKTIDLEILRQLEDLKEGKKEGNVRNALPSGKSEFLRPMPGKARMYPETDLPLLKIGRDRINESKKKLPKLRHEIRDELKKKGLNEELISLVLDGNLDEFEILLRVYDKDANLVAKMVTLWRNEFAVKLKKDFEEIKNILSERVFEKILEEASSGKIDENDVKTILSKIVSGEDVESALKVEKVDNNLLEEEISKIVKEKPGLRANAYMGLVMAKFKGKLDARKAMEILNRVVSS